MSNACTDVKPQLLGYQLGACEPGHRYALRHRPTRGWRG